MSTKREFSEKELKRLNEIKTLYRLKETCAECAINALGYYEFDPKSCDKHRRRDTCGDYDNLYRIRHAKCHYCKTKIDFMNACIDPHCTSAYECHDATSSILDIVCGYCIECCEKMKKIEDKHGIGKRCYCSGNMGQKDDEIKLKLCKDCGRIDTLYTDLIQNLPKQLLGQIEGLLNDKKVLKYLLDKHSYSKKRIMKKMDMASDSDSDSDSE